MSLVLSNHLSSSKREPLNHFVMICANSYRHPVTSFFLRYSPFLPFLSSGPYPSPVYSFYSSWKRSFLDSTEILIIFVFLIYFEHGSATEFPCLSKSGSCRNAVSLGSDQISQHLRHGPGSFSTYSTRSEFDWSLVDWIQDDSNNLFELQLAILNEQIFRTFLESLTGSSQETAYNLLVAFHFGHFES